MEAKWDVGTSYSDARKQVAYLLGLSWFAAIRRGVAAAVFWE